MKAVHSLKLYIVVEAKVIVLCSLSGYRTLGWSVPGRLKKKCSACRYCRRLRGILTGLQGYVPMSKRELIDCICEINKTAKPEFLASFSEEDLNAYLEHLSELDLEELVVCS